MGTQNTPNRKKKQHRGVNAYQYKYWEHPKNERVQKLPVNQLKPFEEQPFKVLLDESMDELVDSIKESGVLSPIIARPHKDGGYEILSGHRRAKACEIAGIKNVPVIVKNLDDDTATILLVDSNLQREHILPSEKAYAYRLKLEAMKRQGKRTDLTCDQIGHKSQSKKSVELIAENAPDSRNQIQRYIRLTELIDPLLNMVDEKKLPLNAAVELSYLGSKAQSDVVKSIERNEITPSIEQSAKIRRISDDGLLSAKLIDKVIREQKPEKIRITLKEDKLREYFPEEFTPKQIEDTIMELIANWAKSRKRNEPER
ncbi:MAG: ParB/RepB/Spo0J family partition protein [Monoglobales bacterium]